MILMMMMMMMMMMIMMMMMMMMMMMDDDDDDDDDDDGDGEGGGDDDDDDDDYERNPFRPMERLVVRGIALSWLRSYLSERYQQVYCNGSLSSPRIIKFGVP